MADTIRELQEILRKFRDERDWMQFHNHKDMATALAIEAAELQELFLWKRGDEMPLRRFKWVTNELSEC